MTITEGMSTPVGDFDIYDPALASPVDVFQERDAELRARGPIVYSFHYGGHWIVTRYDEIFRILRDADTFSSYPNNTVVAGQGKFIPVESIRRSTLTTAGTAAAIRTGADEGTRTEDPLHHQRTDRRLRILRTV